MRADRFDLPHYRRIGDGIDLPAIVMQQAEHFFTHHKDLEAEQRVRIDKWGDAEEARQIVVESIERTGKSG